MNRKELMQMIAVATGISIAGGDPSNAADLHPELEEPPFEAASGEEDPGGDPFGGY